MNKRILIVAPLNGFLPILIVLDHRALLIAWLIAAASGIMWVTHGFVNDGERLAADSKRELRRQKIAELEKDLGYEPLNLHELDDILMHEYKQEKKDS